MPVFRETPVPSEASFHSARSRLKHGHTNQNRGDAKRVHTTIREVDPDHDSSSSDSDKFEGGICLHLGLGKHHPLPILLVVPQSLLGGMHPGFPSQMLALTPHTVHHILLQPLGMPLVTSLLYQTREGGGSFRFQATIGSHQRT